MREARAGRISNEAKHNRILAILRKRKEPCVQVVERFEDEADAIALETTLINTLPNLTNIARAGYLSANQVSDPVKYLTRWLRMVEKWPNGATFPGMYNGHIAGHNFLVRVRKLLAECEDRNSSSHKPLPTESVRSWLTGPVSGPFARQTTSFRWHSLPLAS